MSTITTQSTHSQQVSENNNTKKMINEYINLKVLIIESLRAQKYPANFTYPLLKQIKYTIKEHK